MFGVAAVPTTGEAAISMPRSTDSEHGTRTMRRSLGMSQSAVHRRNMKRYRIQAELLLLSNREDEITTPREYKRVCQVLPAALPSDASIASESMHESGDATVTTDKNNDVNCDSGGSVNRVDFNAEETTTPFVRPSTVVSSADDNGTFMEVDEDARNGTKTRVVELDSTLSSSGHDLSAIRDDNMEDDEIETSVRNTSIESNESQSNTVPCATETDGNMFAINCNRRLQETPILKNGVTNLDIIASVIAMSVRCKLTYTATSLILKSMNNIVVDDILPRTMGGLWSIMSKNNAAAMTRHLYCRHCYDDEIGTGEIPTKNCVCGQCQQKKKSNSVGHFIELKIEPQIRQLLSDPAIVDSLRYRWTRQKENEDAMEDIYDGAKYKEKCAPGGFLSNEYNYSFSLFTDGCQVSNSSKASAWPILLQINELPPHARKRHTILAAIWVDTIHPDMDTIMIPTIRELMSLYDKGLRWTHPTNGTVITSKFVTLVCIADSVARPAILNMTRFNGLYGCTFCYAKGKTHEGRGGKLIFPIDETAERRTDSRMREDMETAHTTGQRSFGVIGLTPMMLLQEFDLAVGPVVESMHNVFLGVAKLHTTFLLHGKVKDPWYTGSPHNIANINFRLMGMRPPSRIARKPRPTENMKQWKASEWRNWIQFYALPCLEGIIRDCDLQHLALLSHASWIMNKNSISTEEMQEAHLLLGKYVQQFQRTFGKRHMRYNIHLLTHLADTIENWGPFWAHSAFPYESWNKKIIDKVTSANGRPLQIATRFLMTTFIEHFLIDKRNAIETRRRVFSILRDGSKNTQSNFLDLSSFSSKFRPIGKHSRRQLDTCELHVLRHHGHQTETATFFRRALINGITFQCAAEDGQRKTRHCDEFLYCHRYGYGKILAITSFISNDETKCGLFIERIGSTNLAFSARHIENAVPTSRKAFVGTDENILPAMIMNTEGQYRITRMPNVWETD